jgi:23S rRNA (pseudouridine1915-N3)-methyltransferase
MNLRLIAVDKIRTRYVAQACEEFRMRLRPFFGLEEIDLRPASGVDPERARRDEGARIARHLRRGEPYWVLDPSGEQLSSPELSARLADAAREGTSSLALVIGGVHGLSADVTHGARFRWSLSRLTFLHEWARMIVLEQLYRAAKIARNEPYHH